MKSKKMKILKICALLFAVFFWPFYVEAIDLCCVYYEGAKSDKCNVYTKETGNAMNITGGAGPAQEFECSKFKKTDNKVEGLLDGKDYTLFDTDVVASVNFQGGYFGNKELGPVIAKTDCFAAKNYTVDVFQIYLNNSYEQKLCELAEKKAANNPNLTSALNVKVESELEKVKTGFDILKSLESKMCCVPKKISPDSSCVQPVVRADIESEMNKFLGSGAKEIPAPLMGFAGISPDTASTNDGKNNAKIASFYSCGEQAGAQWQSAYDLVGYPCSQADHIQSLAGIHSKCRQDTYYCLCKKDESECDNKWYAFLDKPPDNTLISQNWCNKDLGSKEADEPSEWACFETNPPAEIKEGKYCDHLIKLELYDSVEFVIPDTGGLNLLGTNDLPKIIGRVIKTMMGIAGSVALAMFVYSGIIWMTASGSTEKEDKSKKILVWSSLGVIVIFASYALLNFVFEIVK